MGGKTGVLNCLQTIGFEIICTKTDKMSQTTKPLRRYIDENEIVVKNWGVLIRKNSKNNNFSLMVDIKYLNFCSQ